MDAVLASQHMELSSCISRPFLAMPGGMTVYPWHQLPSGQGPGTHTSCQCLAQCVHLYCRHGTTCLLYIILWLSNWPRWHASMGCSVHDT